jgi:hypothetical protein
MPPRHITATSPSRGSGEGCEREDRWDSQFRTAELASPVYVSWNQLDAWLKTVDGLRRAA